MEEEGRREGMVKVIEEWKRCKGRGEEKGKMVASILHGETFNHAEDLRPSLTRWLCLRTPHLSVDSCLYCPAFDSNIFLL